ncbi:hypothetical protein [Microbacterium paraoxydans]|uniref:hypothetical protein n=1 Tax=Microbacterium paraoxydans TaxID=199592 RepID=UPI001CFB946E|nr:hypothetical protein [Microbacterium paraoxydans]
MHWFIVDETNRDYAANHFFIVGGLVFTAEQIEPVDQAVREIRERHGYLQGDSFKFDTRARPEQVSIAESTAAKGELIAALQDIGVRMITYVILHDLCMNQTYDVRMNFALNTLAYAYHSLLAEERATGVMLMDRDNDRYGHLESLFQTGLQFPGGRTYRLDYRIKLFGMTNDNASHLSSAADIALGAFRYCVNTAGGWGRDAVARGMFPGVSSLMWGVEQGDVRRIGGYGFHSRPQRVGKQEFRDLYDNLRTGLMAYANAED